MKEKLLSPIQANALTFCILPRSYTDIQERLRIKDNTFFHGFLHRLLFDKVLEFDSEERIYQTTTDGKIELYSTFKHHEELKIEMVRYLEALKDEIMP